MSEISQTVTLYLVFNDLQLPADDDRYRSKHETLQRNYKLFC